VEEIRISYKILDGRPGGKNHLENLGVDGENTKIYIKKNREDVDWIHLAQDKVQ
jgi:hypothetical protein